MTFFAAFQLFPTAPLRLRELGAQLSESGYFLGIFTLGSSLGALLTGQLGDRIGHRRMMVGSALGFMALVAAYAFIPVRWGFYVLAPLQGPSGRDYSLRPARCLGVCYPPTAAPKE